MKNNVLRNPDSAKLQEIYDKSKEYLEKLINKMVKKLREKATGLEYQPEVVKFEKFALALKDDSYDQYLPAGKQVMINAELRAQISEQVARRHDFSYAISNLQQFDQNIRRLSQKNENTYQGLKQITLEQLDSVKQTNNLIPAYESLINEMTVAIEDDDYEKYWQDNIAARKQRDQLPPNPALEVELNKTLPEFESAVKQDDLQTAYQLLHRLFQVSAVEPRFKSQYVEAMLKFKKAVSSNEAVSVDEISDLSKKLEEGKFDYRIPEPIKQAA